MSTLRDRINGAGKPFGLGTLLGAAGTALAIFLALYSCQEKRDARIGGAASASTAVAEQLRVFQRHVDETEPIKSRFVAMEAGVNADIRAVNMQLRMLSETLATVQDEQIAQRQIQMQILGRLPVGGGMKGGSK